MLGDELFARGSKRRWQLSEEDTERVLGFSPSKSMRFSGSVRPRYPITLRHASEEVKLFGLYGISKY
jgi:hypothetical protein